MGPFDRTCFTDLINAGWGPQNPAWLSCRTGRGGGYIESYSTILSTSQRPGTTIQTRPKWYRISLSTCIETQKPSESILNCLSFISFCSWLAELKMRGTAPRLTGSLALSIAYGIQADTLDNEYFRIYKRVSESSGEAMVLGAFLVDILPFRGYTHLGIDYGKTLTVDRLPQSNICPPGSPVPDFMRVRTRSRRTSTRLQLVL